MKPRSVALLLPLTFLATSWADEARGPAKDAAWLRQRVEAWQPRPEERAFDAIGWVSDLRAAEALAKKHRRPVFLFTYEGASLSGYRC